jgi:thiamine kinase-like enzyme
MIKFIQYSYTIIKYFPEYRFDIFGVLFKYILHLIIIIRINAINSDCDYYVGTNVVVIVNNRMNIIYRIALNAYANSRICNNYDFLLKNRKYLLTPNAINLFHTGSKYLNNKIVFSSESKLRSKLIEAPNINNETFAEIINQLSIIYEHNQNTSLVTADLIMNKYDHLFIYCPQDWIDKLSIIKNSINNIIEYISDDKTFSAVFTIIHGDLTYRNILINPKIEFIDFDRSEITFPEFDLFLFLIDLHTYKQYQEPTYEQLFNNIFNFIKNDNMTKEIEMFYGLNNKFYENKKILPIIKYCFFYRTLIYTLLNFRFYASEPVTILNKCIYKIEQHGQ